MTTIYAVIPAAGKGSRLALPPHLPKLLLPLTPVGQPPQTTWSILRKKLLAVVNHIHIITSPSGKDALHQALYTDLTQGLVSISIQSQPLGMGEAIFGAYTRWQTADSILIVWGDQVFVSQTTFKYALSQHANQSKTLTLPLTHLTTPYVEYGFNAQHQLSYIRESREGELCHAGWNDVGTFVLSVPDLFAAWQAYTSHNQRGSVTQEINFLPFLLFLTQHNWHLQTTIVNDPVEARGINTLEDVQFFQQHYDASARKSTA